MSKAYNINHVNPIASLERGAEGEVILCEVGLAGSMMLSDIDNTSTARRDAIHDPLCRMRRYFA
jgi:hypothetical protein